MPYLLIQWMDFNQTCLDTLLGSVAVDSLLIVAIIVGFVVVLCFCALLVSILVL